MPLGIQPNIPPPNLPPVITPAIPKVAAPNIPSLPSLPSAPKPPPTTLPKISAPTLPTVNIPAPSLPSMSSLPKPSIPKPKGLDGIMSGVKKPDFSSNTIGSIGGLVGGGLLSTKLPSLPNAASLTSQVSAAANSATSAMTFPPKG